ncbi:MAG: hypothetical protein L0I29_16440 [Hyphomicrobiales bacterium]|nr:hypothetical protein [Hyphomicrobiales bacterium]
MLDEGVGQKRASIPEGCNIRACDRFHRSVSRCFLPANRIGRVMKLFLFGEREQSKNFVWVLLTSLTPVRRLRDWAPQGRGTSRDARSGVEDAFV